MTDRDQRWGRALLPVASALSLSTAATAWLAARPPPGLPQWLPAAALAAQTVTWASTFAVEIKQV